MAVVSILAASPKNGVELMDEMEKMTQGWWRPSPGSVYPLLEQLTKEGMVKKREDGRYELTEKANDELEWSFGPAFRRPRSIEDVLNEIGGFVSYLEDVDKADKPKLEAQRARLRELAKRLDSLSGTD